MCGMVEGVKCMKKSIAGWVMGSEMLGQSGGGCDIFLNRVDK